MFANPFLGLGSSISWRYFSGQIEYAFLFTALYQGLDCYRQMEGQKIRGQGN